MEKTVLAHCVHGCSVHGGGGAGTAFVKIVYQGSGVGMGPGGFTGFGVEAVDGFLPASFFSVVAHGVESSIGNRNRGETNPDLGFPNGVTNFTFPFGFRRSSVAVGSEPMRPVGGISERGEKEDGESEKFHYYKIWMYCIW